MGSYLHCLKADPLSLSLSCSLAQLPLPENLESPCSAAIPFLSAYQAASPLDLPHALGWAQEKQDSFNITDCFESHQMHII